MNRLLNRIKNNRWYWLFYLFCRFSLALGFIIAAYVKIIDERFANGLSEIHPMGSYLTALHKTGFYYQSIGYAQLLAAILLLFNRTVILGALLYLPIIFNILCLSLSVRFDGSMVTAPLMLLANLFILAWHYDRLEVIFPWGKTAHETPYSIKNQSLKFPWGFSLLVISLIGLCLIFAKYGFRYKPRNSMQDCIKEFENSEQEKQGIRFCECLHQEGQSLKKCLRILEK